MDMSKKISFQDIVTVVNKNFDPDFGGRNYWSTCTGQKSMIIEHKTKKSHKWVKLDYHKIKQSLIITCSGESIVTLDLKSFKNNEEDLMNRIITYIKVFGK